MNRNGERARVEEWDGRLARLFYSNRDGRDARATLASPLPDQLDQALLDGGVEIDLDQDQLAPGKAEWEQMGDELALGKFVDFDQNQTSLIQDHQPGFYMVGRKREPAETSAL